MLRVRVLVGWRRDGFFSRILGTFVWVLIGFKVYRGYRGRFFRIIRLLGIMIIFYGKGNRGLESLRDCLG